MERMRRSATRSRRRATPATTGSPRTTPSRATSPRSRRRSSTSGPIVVSTTWYRSWFHPVNGVLPAADVAVGGHAIVAYGWDAKGPPPPQQLGLRLGRLGRLLDAGVPRAAPGRGVEGRRRHRAPDPVRPHRRRPGAAQPERPPDAHHGGGQGRLPALRARCDDDPPREVRRQVRGQRRGPDGLARGARPARGRAGSPAATRGWSGRRTA